MEAAASCPVAGPAQVLIQRVSWRGPFARGGATLDGGGAQFSVVNAGAGPCVIEAAEIDPLKSGNGTKAGGSLALEAALPLPATLEPGARLDFTLTGRLPAKPDAYATAARLRLQDGSGLAVPITINVPAAALWGVACMLLGLFLLGTVNLLAGEGTVKTQLHDALQARQDIHSLLEASPAPQSRAGDIETMDHEFDAAISQLGERRQVSVVDHRDTEAAVHLAAAQVIAQKLRTELAGQRRGAAEIADLRRDWAELQATLGQVGALAGSPPAQSSPDFAGRLDAFLVRYRTRFLRQPTAWVADEVATQFGRMELAYSAEEGDAARDLAINTRRWLRRSARMLNTNLALYRASLVQAGWMLNTSNTMRDRALHDDLSPEARQRILAMLDAASAKMDGEAWLPEWQEAHRLVNAAWTEQVRGAAEMMKQQVMVAIEAANKQTDDSDLDTLREELQAQPDHSLAAKQAGLARMVALWQAHADQVDDPPTQTKLRQHIETVAGIARSGQLQGFGPAYHAVVDDWVAWNGLLVQRAVDRLEHPHCLESYADLQRSTAEIEASLRERPPGLRAAGPQSERWDRQLDQIRIDMQRLGPDAATVTRDCMTPLLGLSQRANQLSAEIFTAGLVDAQIPLASRIQAAASSGVAAAIASIAAEQDHARTLDLTALTAADERVVGRTLSFAVANLDPVWGSSVTVSIDFGDHTKLFQASAEELRQGKAITHVFAAPVSAKISVRAEADAKPGPAPPDESLLGEGDLTVLIAPSPLTRAQSLADAFINLRFLLALLISLTVYYWRYHNRTAVFGAKAYDYVEAFALGFAADLAVDHLPSAVAAVAPGVKA